MIVRGKLFYPLYLDDKKWSNLGMVLSSHMICYDRVNDLRRISVLLNIFV